MVGCRLNQSELETMALQFRSAGHTLTSKVELADLIVINTCTVTAAAASDSRQKIRQASRFGSGQIIVTGCWATLNQHEASTFPGVSQVIGNQGKDDLVPTILNLPSQGFTHKSIQREPIPGSRQRTRAFIKVQDGCDNHCTYCITTLARGSGKSRGINVVLADIQSALDGGTQEIVLTGVHLGSWGHDFEHPSQLSVLVTSILTMTNTPRLRLSSLEPWDISPAFFELWQNPRLCRHLHLPLQSGSAATLKRMGRRITPQAYSELIHQARTAIPNVAITTDIITGFPGETDEEFSESAAFVSQMNFAKGHIFTYSARPGTAAALLPDQVPYSFAKQRNTRMREMLQASSTAYQEMHLEKEVQVLWEKATPIAGEQWELSGLTDNYLRVKAKYFSPCCNQWMKVHVSEIRQGELVGKITHPESRFSSLQDTI